jgi:superfamily II DNA or RNA helicase
MKPRDYQQDCIDATWAEITTATERPATLIVLPTGGGKTIVFAHLSDQWVKSSRGRVLILAHRRELIDQAAVKFERVAGYFPSIEMADSYADGSTLWAGSRVVVGSVATMRGRRLERWAKDYFSLIITDEGHHATAPSYGAIYDHFDQAALVLVTATPDRSDKSPLGKICKSVAYSMQILEAIQKGWLVPIRQKFVHVDSIDLTGVASNWKGDDLDESQLDAVMRQDENIHKIAKPTFETAGTRPTLVFCTGVGHAKAVSDVLNSYRPGCSAYVASYLLDDEGNQKPYPPELREREIADFQAGQRQFLCSCGVFLEGFDAPPTALIAMARPTKSRSLYAQALGRGTRPLDGIVDPHETAEARIAAIAASAKPDMLVLDFVGNSGKHKLIYADDILFPDGTAEEKERARRKAKESSDGANVEDAMREAKAEIEQEQHAKAIEIDKVRRGLATRLLASFHMRDVDPFGHGDVVPQVQPEREVPRPTEKQVKFVLALARRLDKRYDFATVAAMPRHKVQGMIGSMQKQLAKREGVTA